MPVEQPVPLVPVATLCEKNPPTSEEWASAVAAFPWGGGHRAGLRRCLVRAREAAVTVDARIDPRGWTPLHLAIETGSTEAVRLLLDAGANPNAAPSPLAVHATQVPCRPWFPLHAARVLTESTVPPQPPDCRTPLQRALAPALARAGHCCALVPLLLAAGAAPTGISRRAPVPPLFWALEGCMACALRVLDAGGLVRVDRSGPRPIPVFHALLDALIESRANAWPSTPAHASRWESLATRLAEQGANPDARAADGTTVAQRVREGRRQWWWSEVSPRWQAWHSAWRLRCDLERALPEMPSATEARRRF